MLQSLQHEHSPAGSCPECHSRENAGSTRAVAFLGLAFARVTEGAQVPLIVPDVPGTVDTGRHSAGHGKSIAFL